MIKVELVLALSVVSILGLLAFTTGCKATKSIKTTISSTTTEYKFDAGDYYTCLYYAEGAHADEYVRIHDTHIEFYRRLINLMVNNGRALSFDAEMMMISIIKNKRDDLRKRASKDLDKYFRARSVCDKKYGLN